MKTIHTLLGLTLSAILSVPSLKAQDLPWGDEQIQFDRIKVEAPYQTEDPESLDLELTYSILGPTIFELPQADPEQGGHLELLALDGAVDFYSFSGEAWEPVAGGLDLDGSTSPTIVAIPQEDQATVGLLLQVVLSCKRHWNCPRVVTNPTWWGVECYYTCIFVKDVKAGCSGLAPGVTVGGFDTWFFFRSSCPVPVTYVD